MDSGYDLLQAMKQRKAEADPLDLALSSSTFKPKCINTSMGLEVLRPMKDSVKAQAKALFASGWKFYFVDQTRGTCYYSSKTITLPTWAMLREVEYRTWYLCHEMAHALTPVHITQLRPHGIEFMENLIRICPNESIEFELEYKPRNAKASGIGVTVGKKIYTLDDL